jgi:tRNA-2-methylthio-N6-dimethylallyladenosine synthase
MTPDPRKKLGFITLGCQMNKHDSEWIAGVLSGDYQVTEDFTKADLLVINTCAVRGKAEQKFASLLGRLRPLKAKKKDMIIAVAGCVAQEQGEALARRAPMVDIIFGPRTIGRAAQLLEKFHRTGRTVVDVSGGGDFGEYPMRRESAVCAWVSIIQGCDNFCSYCIVPHTRGRERSRRPETIVSEARDLAARGFREITLLGQNVNSYGKGLEETADFPTLLEMLNAVEGIDRIRFITSHPKDLSDRLIGAMADLGKVCPYLHLPLQSGSDRILALMNRGYTASEYFAKVDRLRQRVPGVSLTSDIIVGFPGETDEDFEMTAQAVERADYDNIFLFKYSPRPGTAAAQLPGEVDEKIVGERFSRILALQDKIGERICRGWIGKSAPVLVEGPSKKDPSKSAGRTPENILVHFQSENDYTGQIIHVKIVSAGRYSLEGRLDYNIPAGP